jgi:hypothetical protein
MQIDDSSKMNLLEEITIVFPSKVMPQTGDLIVNKGRDSECNYLREDLDAARGQPVTGAVIRLVHQELTCLSVKALQWILPYYLRYCLSDDGQESRMETEFLIYSFSPLEEFKEAALQRFTFLQRDQIVCLLHFVDWCSAHPYWGEYFPEDLQRAREFLRSLS